MSSKLKVKPRKQRLPLAQSNQAAQAFGRAMINCHSQIKSMEREAYENGFNDGEDWADTINVVTTMMAPETFIWLFYETFARSHANCQRIRQNGK